MIDKSGYVKFMQIQCDVQGNKQPYTTLYLFTNKTSGAPMDL